MILNLLSVEIIILVWNIQSAARGGRNTIPPPSYANGPADPLSLGIGGGQPKGMTGFGSSFLQNLMSLSYLTHKVQKCLPFGRIVSQINPDHTVTFCLFKLHFCVSHCCSKWLLLFRFNNLRRVLTSKDRGQGLPTTGHEGQEG